MKILKNINNVVLIGMPGVGKSTVGRLVSERLDAAFLDTDDLIRSRYGMTLKEIIEREGLEAFYRREEDVILDLRVSGCVVATGGSVIYYQQGMDSLTRLGRLVWLDLSLGELECRLADTMVSRGVAIASGRSLADLYRERCPLYKHYADIRVETSGLTPAEVAEELCRVLKAN